MGITVESKLTFETTGHYHEGQLKTKPCEVGKWFGEERSELIDINEEIQKVKMPDGEYKVTITLEKVNING